ncbi:GntR family transcriptional regulator [Acidithrix ferrooxidans]|uniref:HTH-type transcriptional regulator McbR n=1 Tax=Acidithrix ferrooxidans TaxID=1280514 RepID=A0A0D8HIQ8_9ACTN|nr:GntR family transcriptional regulator [Acidithrix ferrooxidans]KJF17672.1 HTH-type transcriptional regulator McbR [Acidithrix ferrooxidans]
MDSEGLITGNGNPPKKSAATRRSTTIPASIQAYDLAKHKILVGTFPGGELISEGEIADQLQISRTPVREAFLRLQSEGLLRLYPKKGAMVVPVSKQEIEMVFETRLLLERFAVEKVFDTQMAVFVADEIDSLVQLQMKALEDKDPIEFAELDRTIHTSILNATANSILANLYSSLRDRQIRMFNILLYLNPVRVETIVKEHKGFATLLRQNDRENLIIAITDHARLTRDALLDGNI